MTSTATLKVETRHVWVQSAQAFVMISCRDPLRLGSSRACLSIAECSGSADTAWTHMKDGSYSSCSRLSTMTWRIDVTLRSPVITTPVAHPERYICIHSFVPPYFSAAMSKLSGQCNCGAIKVTIPKDSVQGLCRMSHISPAWIPHPNRRLTEDKTV